MATKAPTKASVKKPAAQPEKVEPKKVEIAAETPAPVPPVADAAPALIEETPVVAVAAIESVVENIQETVAAVTPAALIEKGNTMADTIKDFGKNLTAQGEKFVAELKTRTEDAVAKGKTLFADSNEFNKGNIEALVESGKIAAKGFEKLGQDAAEYTRKSFEHTTAAFKGMAAVKSPTELLKLQSDYVRSSFDLFVAEASRSTEASLKLAGEIAQPISNRFAVAAEKVKLAA